MKYFPFFYSGFETHWINQLVPSENILKKKPKKVLSGKFYSHFTVGFVRWWDLLAAYLCESIIIIYIIITVLLTAKPEISQSNGTMSPGTNLFVYFNVYTIMYGRWNCHYLLILYHPINFWQHWHTNNTGPNGWSVCRS